MTPNDLLTRKILRAVLDNGLNELTIHPVAHHCIYKVTDTGMMDFRVAKDGIAVHAVCIPVRRPEIACRLA